MLIRRVVDDSPLAFLDKWQFRAKPTTICGNHRLRNLGLQSLCFRFLRPCRRRFASLANHFREVEEKQNLVQFARRSLWIPVARPGGYSMRLEQPEHAFEKWTRRGMTKVGHRLATTLNRPTFRETKANAAVSLRVG